MGSDGWHISSGRLIRHKSGGLRFDEPLPDKHDIAGINILRDKIKAYGERHGLNEGAITAGLKVLTEAGYYVNGPRDFNARMDWHMAGLGVPKKLRQEVLEGLKKWRAR